jgi:hypothetical protein
MEQNLIQILLAAINSVTEPSNMDKLTLKSCRDWERGVMRYQMDGAEPHTDKTLLAAINSGDCTFQYGQVDS